MNPEPDNGYPVTLPLLAGDYEKGLDSTYRPHAISGSTSFFKTCFNGLNALSGVGILSVPYALSSGGWLSLILLFVIASSTFYTGLLIQRCMDMDPTIGSYPDIGYRAFGFKGRAFVSIAMNMELYLVAIGFLILEGDNLHNILPYMEFQIGGLVIGGRQSFIVIVALIILPTVWLNNMSILSYMSASGVLASFILLGSILWAGAFDGIGFHENGTLLNLKGIPAAVSLYAFCYCAHPVFPTLYTSMRNQKKFSKVNFHPKTTGLPAVAGLAIPELVLPLQVLLLCFLVCTISYASIAVLGYLMYGSKVQSQITLNLPTNKISSRVAICTTLVNPIAKYALMVTPIVRAAENRFLTFRNKRLLSIMLRSTLVISTVIVALAIPLFGYLMSLVGAFLSVTASIILPCLCYLKISGAHQRFGFELLFIGGIVVMGIAIMVVGTYTSLKEIIGHLVG